MITILRHYWKVLKTEYMFSKFRQSIENEADSKSAELIRFTHALEKGLSLESPRLGFGKEKISQMMILIQELEKLQGSYYREVCSMGLDALKNYLIYHQKKGFSSDSTKCIEEFLSNRAWQSEKGREDFGGSNHMQKEQLSFNIEEVERVFNTRHSIRDFDSTPADKKAIMKAIELAQKAPSACNRQAVRAYILGHEKSMQYAKMLMGVGGFENSVSNFILVTGKMSMYRVDEANQYIVSASIFCGYLSLTLHLYGLGACVIQRPLLYDPSWKEYARKNGIPDDEQLVCCIAVGNLKDQFDVPVSHRFSACEIAKWVE